MPLFLWFKVKANWICPKNLFCNSWPYEDGSYGESNLGDFAILILGCPGKQLPHLLVQIQETIDFYLLWSESNYLVRTDKFDLKSDKGQIYVVKERERGGGLIFWYWYLCGSFCHLRFTSLVFLSSSERRTLLYDFLGLSIFSSFPDLLSWNKSNFLPHFTHFSFLFIANKIEILCVWCDQLIKYDWLHPLLTRRQPGTNLDVIIQVAPSVSLLSTQIAEVLWEQLVKYDWLDSWTLHPLLNWRLSIYNVII